MEINQEDINRKFHDAFIKRLIELRNNENISARELSLCLGQNVNYINLIENGKRLPSLQGFFNICDFFHIKPSEFFIKEIEEEESKKEQLITLINNMSISQIEALYNFISTFLK